MQIVTWIGARLREPSTYAGIAALLTMFGIAHAQDWQVSLMSIGVGVGGLIAILMPEGK